MAVVSPRQQHWHWHQFQRAEVNSINNNRRRQQALKSDNKRARNEKSRANIHLVYKQIIRAARAGETLTRVKLIPELTSAARREFTRLAVNWPVKPRAYKWRPTRHNCSSCLVVVVAGLCSRACRRRRSCNADASGALNSTQ